MALTFNPISGEFDFVGAGTTDTTLGGAFAQPAATTPATLLLKEATNNGTNKVSITVPDSMTSDKVITFPSKDGTVLLDTSAMTTEIPVSYTPTDNSTNVLLLGTSRNFTLDASSMGSGEDFTITMSGVPIAGIIMCTVLVIVGANVPTVAWPQGVTAPILLANKTHWYTLATVGDSGTTRDASTGTCRIFAAGEF